MLPAAMAASLRDVLDGRRIGGLLATLFLVRLVKVGATGRSKYKDK